jgi:hypothetical protein
MAMHRSTRKSCYEEGKRRSNNTEAERREHEREMKDTRGYLSCPLFLTKSLTFRPLPLHPLEFKE